MDNQNGPEPNQNQGRGEGRIRPVFGVREWLRATARPCALLAARIGRSIPRPARFRPYITPSFAGFLLAVAAMPFLAQITGAATAVLSPDEDIVTDWPTSTGGSYYTEINEGTMPDTNTYVATEAEDVNYAVEFGMESQSNIEEATELTLRVHVNPVEIGNNPDALTLSLIINGATVQDQTFDLDDEGNWRWLDITATGSWSQADIDSMQVELLREIQGGGNPGGRGGENRVSTVYVDMEYTPATNLEQDSYRWFENEDAAQLSEEASWRLLETLEESGGFVASVIFSPDEEYIAYSGTDANVYIHSADDWSHIQTLTESGGTIHSVTFSPDGNYIAYSSNDANVYIHSTDDWSHEQTLTEAGDGTITVAFSPDSGVITYGSVDNNVYIHSTDDWSHEQTLTEASDWPTSVAFSPDGEHFVYASLDHDVYIHATNDWSHQQTLTEAGDELYSLAFAPGGEYLAYGGGDTNAHVHSTDNWSHEQTLTEAGNTVRTVTISSSGYITYGGDDDNVYVHSTGDWSHEQTLTEAGDFVQSISFSPDQKHIAYGSSDDNVYIHQVLEKEAQIGNPLEPQDTPAEAEPEGTPFRLRATASASQGDLASGSADFNLQYARAEAGQICTDVTGYELVGKESLQGDWSSIDAWPKRSGFAATVFNGKIWVYGGRDDDTGDTYDDVWYSENGITWTQATASADWSSRGDLMGLTYDEKLWALGGEGDGGEYYDDVWYSEDGINWEEATNSAAWNERSGAVELNYNGYMWLIGGYVDDGGDVRFDDVWRSDDGENWAEVTASADWVERNLHTGTVFDGEMYIMGGWDGSAGDSLSDVWRSSDGDNWVEVTGNADWPGKEGGSVIAYDDEMWIMNGLSFIGGSSNLTNDVWTTDDGENWTEATSNAGWEIRANQEAVVFDGQAWMFGGTTDAGAESLNDVWHASDSSNWNETKSGADWGERDSHASTVFDDKLWVLGGSDGSEPRLNDVWYSDNGFDWDQATGDAGWDGRSAFQSTSFDGKLWIAGGFDGDDGRFNDVWSSSDGINWTEETASAPWSERNNFQLLSFDDKLWVIGGTDGSSRLNDVWHSEDGESWTEATGDADWSARNSHQSVVFNDSIWVIGGDDGNVVNDIWHSEDGESWTEATGDAGWPGRHLHGAAATENTMWVTGGLESGTSGELNDVWFSTDGEDWEEYTSDAPWDPRYTHTLEFYDGVLWNIGGFTDDGRTDAAWWITVAQAVIRFHDNANIPDGASLEPSADDPDPGSGTAVYQSYVESNSFTNPETIPDGDYGLWDFALVDNGALAESTYCFRIVYEDGEELNTYSQIAELDIPPPDYTQADYRWFENEIAELSDWNEADTADTGGDIHTDHLLEDSQGDLWWSFGSDDDGDDTAYLYSLAAGAVPVGDPLAPPKISLPSWTTRTQKPDCECW